jgi:glucan phosphoethanolaminetransferase (alkaline phosphatase superfamily)
MQAWRLRLAAAFLVLCLPYAALGIWLVQLHGLRSAAAFLVSVTLMLWSIALVTRTWRRFFLLQVPLLVLGAAFATYTLTFDSPPGKGIAYVLATSSWDEISGFFSVWEGRWLLLAAVALLSVYLLLAARFAPRPMSLSGTRYLRWSPLLAVLFLSVYAAQDTGASVEGITANPLIGTALFVAGPLRQAMASVGGTALRKVPYAATRADATEEVHILVVGESARRDSWSAYGYRRRTTPYLEKIRDEVILFQNAVADANLTVYAVPILLTGTTPGRFDMKAITGNLVDLAGEAGYSTAWLMNQDPHISLLTGIHADQMVYPQSISTLIGADLPFDESLLPDLRRLIEVRGKPRFIGLHIFGSHWDYGSRYPAAFKQFGAGEELSHVSFLSGEPDTRVLDAYDNSIAYTDWFLGQVIEQARKLAVPATVTYFSDHGEDLFLLDGRAGHGTHSYSKHQYAIPGFVWVNSAYRAAHPDKVRAVMQNAAMEIRSHNIFYSLADLMGIQWPQAIPAESFASPLFQPDLSAPLIAGGALIPHAD